jgi:large subunit ribosomal protein L28
MAQVCEITGKGPFSGNKVSHSNRKSRTRWIPNLHRKKFMIEELGQTVTLRVSSRGMRSIDKHGGITPALFALKSDVFSARLLKFKTQILKQRRNAGVKKVS